jgi:CRP/FNR family transcriptional regulator, cyclic AMP receptor protein
MITPMALAPADALRNVPLFSGIEGKELTRIANQMKERVFREGSTVVAEGETGAGFFVIAEGNATVSIGGDVRATLGPGDHFGEIALIDDGVRSASITAATDLRCYGLTPWEFRPFIEEHPQVAWVLLRTLAKRIRSTNS